jgi:hypothetical protein
LQFDGALVREQGQTFGIVVVKPSVGAGGNHALSQAQASFANVFGGGVPVVLMWQDARGLPSYWGRKDIVNFLAKLDPSRIPWRKYTLTSS